MRFQKALSLLIQILRHRLSRNDITPSTTLDVDDATAQRFAEEISQRVGTEIVLRDVRTSQTVSDLAQLIAIRTESYKTGLAERDDVRQRKPAMRTRDRGYEYVVWFATNRRSRAALSGDMIDFSSQRSNETTYGKCVVFLPKYHKIGSVGSSWVSRLLRGDDRLSLERVDTLSADLYWEQVKRALDDVQPEERDAVVFIHGYNVSFVDAAIRAGQIGFDLGVKGVMAFFSWPSDGKLTSYMVDEATIEASEVPIAEFLGDIAEKSKARAVHIIAHSMGNRGVLRALSRIAAVASTQTGVRFNQIILAAPDVDTEVFKRLSNVYTRVASRTTLYVSSKDRAVSASEWLHGFPRAGLSPPICIVPGIDTINVTNVDLTSLGHGYVAEARDVLQDMYNLIANDSPPDKRFGLRRQVTQNGEVYWDVGA